jgi:hypothetical protein
LPYEIDMLRPRAWVSSDNVKRDSGGGIPTKRGMRKTKTNHNQHF